MKKLNVICFYIFITYSVNTTVATWFPNVREYLGLNSKSEQENIEIYEQKIPYEVATADENFIKEAAKLTDLTLSELDSCQHRVILKLKHDCDKLNDEQLAKMAVHLLNCQSWVEGRPIYPCTDEMSIKDCTLSMDSDTWTSYHLMSNRARAVCYTVRQSQFRGLAEYTVNKLMDAARNQLQNLGEISSTQNALKHLTEKTYLTLNEGHKYLSEQQNDLMKAQFQGQLTIEDNIKRLIDEKRLIAETHNNLVALTQSIQHKLDTSVETLQYQSKEYEINHNELINDLLVIQEKTNDIFEKIEQSSFQLIQQNEEFNRQYTATLKSLKEMNKTVNDLLTLVKRTCASIEEQLNWIIMALGGTDLAIDRIYLVVWHSAFILMSMLVCAFLSAKPSTRLAVAILPPLNLAVALHGEYQCLDSLSLSAVIGSFVAAQSLLVSINSMRPTIMGSIAWKKESHKDVTSTKSSTLEDKNSNYEPSSSTGYDEDENKDAFQDFTPPASRNGNYVPPSASRSRSRTPLLINLGLKGCCMAKTRMGTPCKLNSLPGRDFCYRHQTGSSVFG